MDEKTEDSVELGPCIYGLIGIMTYTTVLDFQYSYGLGYLPNSRVVSNIVQGIVLLSGPYGDIIGLGWLGMELTKETGILFGLRV